MARPSRLSLLLVCLFACGKHQAAAPLPPPEPAALAPPAVPARDGWCEHGAWHGQRANVAIEVDPSTLATRPLREGGFHSYGVGWEEGRIVVPAHDLWATLDDGVLRLWKAGDAWCRGRNMPCPVEDPWLLPPIVELEDRLAPRDACIQFSIQEEAGYVVGLARDDALELRLYTFSDTGPPVARERPQLLPRARYVPGPVGTHVLVEEGGTGLHRFSWKRDMPPAIERSDVAFVEPPVAWKEGDAGTLLFVSPRAITALDPRSFTKRWERRAHVTSFIGQWKPPTVWTATVEDEGVRVTEIDEKTGAVRRQALVWKGSASSASIERGDDGTFVLLVETA